MNPTEQARPCHISHWKQSKKKCKKPRTPEAVTTTDHVALVCTEDSVWRNRADFFCGRPMIREFLKRKWANELDYRLKKELWAFTGNRISVRFEYEWHDDSGFWFRSHGNEQWEFDERGLMCRREASVNDVPIKAADRKFNWPHPVVA